MGGSPPCSKQDWKDDTKTNSKQAIFMALFIIGGSAAVFLIARILGG